MPGNRIKYKQWSNTVHYKDLLLFFVTPFLKIIFHTAESKLKCMVSIDDTLYIVYMGLIDKYTVQCIFPPSNPYLYLFAILPNSFLYSANTFFLSPLLLCWIILCLYLSTPLPSIPQCLFLSFAYSFLTITHTHTQGWVLARKAR